MRKLKDIIKYYNDKSIIVRDRYTNVGWGNGSEHIIKRYYPDLLEKKVENITVDYQGKRVLILGE